MLDIWFFSDTQGFDVEHVLQYHMQNQVICNLDLSFCLCCLFNNVKFTMCKQWCWTHVLKGLVLFIQYVGKEKYLYIIDEYDKYVVFLLLVHAYKYQNSSTTCEILVTTYTHQSKKEYIIVWIHEDWL
jgi:hypothetical protein